LHLKGLANNTRSIDRSTACSAAMPDDVRVCYQLIVTITPTGYASALVKGDSW